MPLGALNLSGESYLIVSKGISFLIDLAGMSPSLGKNSAGL